MMEQQVELAKRIVQGVWELAAARTADLQQMGYK